MAEATPNRLADARTLLFVPGNRPERFEKAVRSGADAVILDLEDSVPKTDKAAARGAIKRDWARLSSFDLPLVVRINPVGSEEGESDLHWLRQLTKLAAVMLPKTEAVDSMTHVQEFLGGTALLPMIESAAGFAMLNSVAVMPGVLRLVIGHIDFMADTGLHCDASESELAPLRFAVTMATRMHRLAPAVDGVTLQIRDDARLRDDTRRALRFGFGGKLCIHPRQVAVVHEAMSPSPQEIDWAQRVVAADVASRGAAVQLDGQMVDAPVVAQARRTLARAAK